MNALFVDDQVSVLEGISAQIHFQELGIDQAYYATGAEQAMCIIACSSIDILVCDIEMPGENGLQLIQKVHRQFPNVVSILLTSHADFEYAQEGVRLGCFDYILQPAPFEVIESVLRRALQFCYERQKRNQLYEVGRRMQMGEMELLDRVAMNLFSSDAADSRSAMDLLNLIGYEITPSKQVQLLLLSVEQFRKTDSDKVFSAEKEVHKLMMDALKKAEVAYPLLPLSTLNRHREFILLVFSAVQDVPNINLNQIQAFFNFFCHSIPNDSIHCYVGQIVTFDSLQFEYRQIRNAIVGKSADPDIQRLDYEPNCTKSSDDYISGSGERWRGLLAAGQYRILMNEFEDCLNRIITSSPHVGRALCDLHQRMTHMFFTYFYNNNSDVHALFDQYSYFDYMSSYSSPDALRAAMEYMIKKVKEISTAQISLSDVEKAKNFILDNLSEAISVKDVADHVCLSAEYFTKLFKKETGQNIKEYIIQTKIEAAKEMLEKSNISVGMVALELGFTNFSHFSQVFKKYENVTPSEYRANLHGEISHDQ